MKAILNKYLVKRHSKEALETVKEDKYIEGYVVHLKDGQRVKIKTDWYCTIHKTKDSISTPKNLYECCLKEGSDDLLAMFAGDTITIKQIEEMRERATKDYFDLKNTCIDWYQSNKELSRKDYAIKTREHYTDSRFGLCMNLYLGKENDYIKVLVDSFT